MSDKWLNYDLYIGDVNEEELYSWLCANISPLVMTTRAEWSYYDMYHGDNDLWIMHSQDVSDVSGSPWDVITQVSFKNKEDAVMTKLCFGGSFK
jgi:hypothetical protein